MARISKRLRRLWDTYSFEGFRAEPVVRGVFGDPKDNVSRNLLIEPERVNLALYSQQLDNSYWTKSYLTVNATDILAPDGSLTATQLNETDIVQYHNVYTYTYVNISGSGVRHSVVSAYVKYLGRQWIALGINAPSIARAAYFDVLHGIKGSLTGYGNIIIDDYGIESVGDGWFRLWIRPDTTGSSETQMQLSLTVATGDGGGFTVDGDVTKGFYAWQFQLEDNCYYMTSPIVTTDSTATRDADLLYCSASSYDLPGDAWCTALAKVSPIGLDADMTILDSGSNTFETEGFRLNKTTSDYIRGAVFDSSSTQCDITASADAFTKFNPKTVALAYTDDDFELCSSDTSRGIDTSGDKAASHTYLRIGFSGDPTGTCTNVWGGHIHWIALVRRRLGISEITKYTDLFDRV